MNEIISGLRDLGSTIQIYPNPVDSEFFIENTHPDDVISIYSLQGMLIKRVIVNSTLSRVDVHNFSPGIYLLELSNNNSKRYQKIIVK